MPAPVRVFVSHSHHDNEWCREFVGILQSAGADVWYDEKGLSGGAEWVATIQREVQARGTFLIVLTPHAWDSRWVHEELNLALATNRRILPVLHLPTQVEGFLLTRQWVRAEGLSGADAACKVAEIFGLRIPSDASSMPRAIVIPARPAPPTLPAVGPAPAPAGATPAPHLTPTALYTLGFRGYTRNGVEFVLPPICPVPSGVFTMGSDTTLDSQAVDRELPQHPIALPAFQIGTFPVTVAEYTCFVHAGQREPQNWQQQVHQLDHPVVNVSWHTAIDYAAWLAKFTGQPWRLPTEAEWEKAARGADGRIYPWGNAWDPSQANTREAGRSATTSVGSYPTGASPYGAQDMAGNVWEWTSSFFNPYGDAVSSGRQDLNSTGDCVLRGGSWDRGPRSARAACRGKLDPRFMNLSSGFRLALGAG